MYDFYRQNKRRRKLRVCPIQLKKTHFSSSLTCWMTSSIDIDAAATQSDTFIKQGSSELEVISHNYYWRHWSLWLDSIRCGCYKVWSIVSMACITHLCLNYQLLIFCLLSCNKIKVRSFLKPSFNSSLADSFILSLPPFPSPFKKMQLPPLFLCMSKRSSPLLPSFYFVFLHSYCWIT